jgi:hypothetical protein
MTTSVPSEPEPEARQTSESSDKDTVTARSRDRMERAMALAAQFLPDGELLSAGDVAELADVSGLGLRAAAGLGISEGIGLADVSATTARYLSQESLAFRYDVPLPAVVTKRDEPLVASIFPASPLGRESLGGGDYRAANDLSAAKEARTQLAYVAERAGNHVVDLAPLEARRVVRRGLTGYLERRLAAREEARRPLRRVSDALRRIPPAGPASPGLPFRVETRSSGLRIHWSPAYFFEPDNVFTFGLSTPVDGWLAPGRYIFGAVGPGLPLVWEFDATYDLPQSRVATLVSI